MSTEVTFMPGLWVTSNSSQTGFESGVSWRLILMRTDLLLAIYQLLALSPQLESLNLVILSEAKDLCILQGTLRSSRLLLQFATKRFHAGRTSLRCIVSNFLKIVGIQCRIHMFENETTEARIRNR